MAELPSEVKNKISHRGKAAQKARFGGEFFIAESAADPHGTRFLEFFQHTRDGTPKGIVALTLGAVP